VDPAEVVCDLEPEFPHPEFGCVNPRRGNWCRSFDPKDGYCIKPLNHEGRHYRRQSARHGQRSPIVKQNLGSN
jgi:hypothetical protein